MCGIVGFWRSDGADVAGELYEGLRALEHRGRESAGIAAWNERRAKLTRLVGEGEVAQALPKRRVISLRGSAGVAHNRYSTAGASVLQNAQPILGEFRGKPFALVHNGNIVNKEDLYKECVRAGFPFTTTSDTGVMAATIALSPGSNMHEALLRAAKKWRGAFSILLLYDGEIFALRDQWGVRPLYAGIQWPRVLFASESRAVERLAPFDARRSGLGTGGVRTFDIPPAGYAHISRNGKFMLWQWTEPQKIQARCLFEYVYFAWHESSLDGVGVLAVRERSGEILAEEAPVPHADFVVPVLDSGRGAGIGYARKLGIPYGENILRKKRARTFIEPDQQRRKRGVALKFDVNLSCVIRGKILVVVDDSLVRNNTAPAVVRLLREAGAAEVHWRNASPPVRFGCHYGIDTYRMVSELAMRRHNDNTEHIRRECGADSLAYLSVEGLTRAVREVSGGKVTEQHLCTACWSGEYRIPLAQPLALHAA